MVIIQISTLALNKQPSDDCLHVKFRKGFAAVSSFITFGKHSKPPPVTLSKANDRTLSGTIAASLQAIIPPEV